MKMKIRKCKSCHRYTLQDSCPLCGGEIRVVFPAKYSPEDKYGKYRRILKQQAYKREKE